jgi:hypothetical protein
MTITAVDVANDAKLVERLYENNMPFMMAFLKANPSGLGIYTLFLAFVAACQGAKLDPYDEFLTLLEVMDGVEPGTYTEQNQ